MSDNPQLDFDMAIDDWAAADVECSRLYLLWQEAIQRRKRAVAHKRAAWLNLIDRPRSEETKEGLPLASRWPPARRTRHESHPRPSALVHGLFLRRD